MEESLLERLRSDSDESDSGPAQQKGRWFVLEDCLAPILGVTVLMPFAIAWVGVVGASSPVLAYNFPTILSAVVLSQAVSSLLFAKLSQFTTCCNVDLLSAAYLAKLVVLIEPQVPKHMLLMYLLVGQGVFCMLLGICLYLIARYDVIWYLRFLPYPVSSGFVTGIGLLIVDGGFELGAGTNMWGLLAMNVSLPPVVAINVGLAVASAGLFMLLQSVMNGALRLPLGILLVTVIFHATVNFYQIDMATLQAHDVFLNGLEAEPWTKEWKTAAHELLAVDWRVFTVAPCLLTTISYLLLHVISYPFYTAGMQEIDMPPSGKLDLQKEVKLLGLVNMVMGCIMGVPVSHSFKVCVLMKQSGAKTRSWVVMLSFALALLYFECNLRQKLGVVPKCAFGGLVLSLGCDFLSKSLVESKSRIAPAEWRFVLATALVTYINVLMGLAFGLMLMMSFFIVEYASITGIVRKSSLGEVRSLAERPAEENKALNRKGGRAAVFWCAGYIFFGTAANIVEEVEDHIDLNPTRIVIIDFEFVPAVDASGLHTLTEFAGRCMKKDPPIQVCFCGMVRRLKGAVESVVRAKNLQGVLKTYCNQVEQALVWAEGQILYKPDVPTAPPTQADSLLPVKPGVLPEDGEHTIREELMALLHFIDPEAPSAEVAACVASIGGASVKVHPRQTVLVSEGKTAKELIYIISGTVSITRSGEFADHHKLPRYHLNEDKGDVFTFEERTEVSVQQAGQGSILGCIEFGTTHEQSIRVSSITGARVASASCRALHVPFPELRRAVSLESPTVLGQVVTAKLGSIASRQMLMLLQSARVKPYRFVSAVPLVRSRP
mmetsp:Transcript_33532/g.85781  ORF Transcript_33532/g.85781 Transcript_33532/m.85781 type:complete len:831 (-) Transcript_33532:314-2806(-)